MLSAMPLGSETHQCHQEVAWGVELLPVPLSRKGVLRRPHLLQGGADPPGSGQDALVERLAEAIF